MVVLFMGSVQLISLGIMGEYIRLIFFESKGRPTYIVAERRCVVGRQEAPDSRGPERADPAGPSSLAQEVGE